MLSGDGHNGDQTTLDKAKPQHLEILLYEGHIRSGAIIYEESLAELVN